MGMERVLTFPNGEPSWPAVRDRITGIGATVQMRMIDNLPAFPDEEPEETWRELRVTLGSGMITVRREPGRFRLVVWGNADSKLEEEQAILETACVLAGSDLIQ